jgi:hypothetical protein
MSDGDRIAVPAMDTPWPEIWAFALSYNAYDRDGGFDGAARIGNDTAKQWANDGSLPEDLALARAALFFEQRRYRHFDTDPDEGGERYVRALVQVITELSGGFVPGPADPLP